MNVRHSQEYSASHDLIIRVIFSHDLAVLMMVPIFRLPRDLPLCISAIKDIRPDTIVLLQPKF